jgi:uncharacterized protein (DUF2132 family)
MTVDPQKHKSDPLHGVTLENLLRELVDKRGWEYMADAVNIRCFYSDPSIQSSLKFIRKTPWARKKVESLYLDYKWECEQLDRERSEV